MAADSKTELEAIVVGAGFSGIATACRLQMDLGLSKFKIFEKATTWGGTWEHSKFPGAGCDIPARLYSLSFAQVDSWEEFFPKKDVIQEYMVGVAQRFDLDRRAHFEHAVQSASFDEVNAHWVVHVKDLQSGQTHRHTARILYSCVGALSVPRECDIKGASEFKGALFHSARWDRSVDIKGKKVVIVGNGCTAAQIVPTIAPDVKQLTQIVRAKHWIAPQLKDPFAGSVFKFLERNMPGFVAFERGAVIALCESHFLQTFKQDGKAARERFAAVSRDYVKRCAPKEYHDVILPRPGELEVSCKRRIYDDGYIVSLGRPNVELTKDQAREIVSDGIILQSGRKVEADVIVLANGFQSDKYACQMEVRNGKGQRLEEYWKEEKGAPQAYRTQFCSTFPNFSIIWGPNAVTGHFSAVFSIERAVEMSMRVLRPIFLTGDMTLSPIQRSQGKSIRVKPEAEDYEQEYIQAAMKGLIFSTGCGSWYTDDSGRVTAVNPSFQMTVAFRSKFPVFDHFDYRGVSQSAAWNSWTLATRIGTLLRLGTTPSPPGNNQHGLLYRFLLSPFHLIRYLATRVAVYNLQALSYVIDIVARYTRPKPFIASHAMSK